MILRQLLAFLFLAQPVSFWKIGPGDFVSFPAGKPKSDVCVDSKGNAQFGKKDSCQQTFCNTLVDLQVSANINGGRKVFRCTRFDSLEELLPQLVPPPSGAPKVEKTPDILEEREKLLTELLMAKDLKKPEPPRVPKAPAAAPNGLDNPPNIDDSAAKDSSKGDFDTEHPFSQTRYVVSFLFQNEQGSCDVVRYRKDLRKKIGLLRDENMVREYLAVFHNYLFHKSRTKITHEPPAFVIKEAFNGSLNCGYWTWNLRVGEAGQVEVLPGSNKMVQPGRVSDC